MKDFFYNKILRVNIALILVLTLLVAFSGCNLIENIIESSVSPSSEISTPKATAPINNSDKTLYGFDNIKDESVRILYGLIDENVNIEEKKVFSVDEELSYRQIYEGICAYKEDHPEVFWLRNSCTFLYNGTETYINLDYLSDFMDYETRVNAQSELEKKVNEIVSNAPIEATQFELEQYVHDYIIDNCEYDYESANSKDDNVEDNTGNAYGVLIEGKAVCEGYSRAFQLICKKLGLECVNIFGISENDNHMWNCIKIENEWYQIDVTWDDTEDEQKKYVQYMFFNLDDEKMYMDHQVGELYENISDEEFENLTTNANLFVPKCTATEYNYHLYYGSVITDVEDSSHIVSAIAQAAKDNRDTFYLTADSSLDFDDVSSKLIEGGYLADWIDSANFKNFYSPNLNVQTEVYTVSKYNLFILALQYI
ncbi:MAG: hypothetical protein J1E85_09840 [Ruminococcus sp.]|nr:hypothetical protein [Ruminococcus sp.]